MLVAITYVMYAQVPMCTCSYSAYRCTNDVRMYKPCSGTHLTVGGVCTYLLIQNIANSVGVQCFGADGEIGTAFYRGSETCPTD